MALIDKIPTSKRDTFLKMILKAYVDQQGLGALPKPDLDSLIIYAFLQNTNDSYSNFELSQLFKIKESRIKSLRELGAVKYEHLGIIDEKIIWVKVFKQILNSMLEVESYDKSQLRFHLDDPAIYRYLQKEVISFGGHVNYNKSSEQVIISYSSFSKLIDHTYNKFFKDKIKQADLNKEIKNLLEKFKIEKEKIKEITGETVIEKKINNSLGLMSDLSSIGQFIIGIVQLFTSS